MKTAFPIRIGGFLLLVNQNKTGFIKPIFITFVLSITKYGTTVYFHERRAALQ
jgi:hypothetical protein